MFSPPSSPTLSPSALSPSPLTSARGAHPAGLSACSTSLMLMGAYPL